jgi:hypothetical protein
VSKERELIQELADCLAMSLEGAIRSTPPLLTRSQHVLGKATKYILQNKPADPMVGCCDRYADNMACDCPNKPMVPAIVTGHYQLERVPPKAERQQSPKWIELCTEENDCLPMVYATKRIFSFYPRASDPQTTIMWLRKDRGHEDEYSIIVTSPSYDDIKKALGMS